MLTTIEVDADFFLVLARLGRLATWEVDNLEKHIGEYDGSVKDALLEQVIKGRRDCDILNGWLKSKNPNFVDWS